MNPTIDVLMKRRSVRSYTQRPIGETEKEVILQAAMRAPTAGAMMLYTIIEVDDQALKDRLSETCDHQPFIATAPYLLLFLADYQRWYDYYQEAGVPELCEERGIEMRRPGAGDLILAACDTLIAAHAAVVAAESLGIGSCYIGDILEQFETHRQMFNLPQWVLPITLVCFGYPAEDPAQRRQTGRFDKEFIVHKNRYRHLPGDDLNRMFAGLNQRFSPDRTDGMANAGQYNFFRKFCAEFSVEMDRSVRAMLASWEGK